MLDESQIGLPVGAMGTPRALCGLEVPLNGLN